MNTKVYCIKQKSFIQRAAYLAIILMLIISIIPTKMTHAHAITAPKRAKLFTDSDGIATADPDGPHSKYDWPVEWSQMAHLLSSYQNYSEDNIDYAYFHRGIDLLTAVANKPVYTRTGGQVVNVENYGGSKWYWEVGILDPEGYVWQFHHLDPNSIPQAIKDAFVAYQANPTTGGKIPPNTFIGEVIDWEAQSMGYDGHHLHLNILAAGDVAINPLEFHNPGTYVDDQKPVINKIGLMHNNRLINGDTVDANLNYSLYMNASDLYKSPVFILAPHKIEFKIDGAEEWTTLWEFRKMPGENDIYSYLHDVYVPYLTKGNELARDFYFNLGFTKDGPRNFPKTPGEHTIQVRIADFAGNTAEKSYTWTVRGENPNTAPVANSQSLTLAYNQAATIILSGSDAEGDALTFKIVEQPKHGTLSGTAPNMVYVPNLGFTGEDSFQFVANDGKLDSERATVNLKVLTGLFLPITITAD